MNFNCKEHSFNEPKDEIQYVFKKFKEGDLKSYNQLKIAYLDYKPEEFIPIAKYAADSLNYTPAYFDVFESYFNKYYFVYDSVENVNLSLMTENDKKEAIYYLEKAIEYNDSSAIHYKILLKK